MHRPTRTATAPSTGITLSVTASKQRGQRYADVTWTGATAVAVLRDNVQVANGQRQPVPRRPAGARRRLCGCAGWICYAAASKSQKP